MGELDCLLWRRMGELDCLLWRRLGELDCLLWRRLGELGCLLWRRMGELDCLLWQRIGELDCLLWWRLGELDVCSGEELWNLNACSGGVGETWMFALVASGEASGGEFNVCSGGENGNFILWWRKGKSYVSCIMCMFCWCLLWWRIREFDVCPRGVCNLLFALVASRGIDCL